jgi:sensor histidine kinase YesM
MSVYSEIKKYLLYLVGFFCLSLAVHLGILYFYSDAETYPIRGGTLNVGIVGKQPVLDILSTDTKIENSSSDTVLRFIYR